jgi:23S rRNA (pseudouridine1915-N3)-methyltransferase
MTITIIAVGSVREPLARAVDDFEGRARRYWKLDLVEVDRGAGRSTRPGDVIAAEEERILARLPTSGRAVALTRKGRGMTSTKLSKWLSERALEACDVSFLVGGAYGLGAGVLEKASRHLSLSPMTLPHEMARLLLLEQLYRAGTILRGEPYHKGRR